MNKFKPIKPFTLYTEGSNFNNKSKTSVFISELVKQHFDISGVTVFVYRLVGVHDQTRDIFNNIKQDNGTDVGSFQNIQDSVLLENRDLKYNLDEIPLIKGTYQVTQNEIDYARFGMALANDVVTMEFHAEEIRKQLGRDMIDGDVIQMTHLREIGVNGIPVDKWYEVKSIVWSPSGYDPTWMRHIRAAILIPMRHRQETLDIMRHYYDEYGRKLEDTASNKQSLMAITEKNRELATDQVETTWFDTTVMWFDSNNPTRKPFRWTDDIKPDNGIIPVGQGTQFPSDAKEGDWFIRTDIVPNRLYRLEGSTWRLREKDIKREWQDYNWTASLREFMSDRSEEDRNRKWKLKSIHDVLTDREDSSDPTGENEPT